jgi:hypothetical protein
MKKSSIRNVAAVVALTAGLVATGGAANAYSEYLDFTHVLPVGSLPVLDKSDTKAVSYTNGNLKITSVGSDYKVRGLMTNIIGTGGTTQTKALGDNSSASLKNHFVVGTLTALQLRISSFNTVAVQVIGKWRAN